MPAALPVSRYTKLSDTHILERKESKDEITAVHCPKYPGNGNVQNGIGPQTNRSPSLPKEIRRA